MSGKRNDASSKSATDTPQSTTPLGKHEVEIKFVFANCGDAVILRTPTSALGSDLKLRLLGKWPAGATNFSNSFPPSSVSSFSKRILIQALIVT